MMIRAMVPGERWDMFSPLRDYRTARNPTEMLEAFVYNVCVRSRSLGERDLLDPSRVEIYRQELELAGCRGIPQNHLKTGS